MIGSFGMDEQGVALTFGAEFFGNPDISSSQENGGLRPGPCGTRRSLLQGKGLGG